VFLDAFWTGRIGGDPNGGGVFASIGAEFPIAKGKIKIPAS
jgi:hypothetical protein